SDQISCGSLNPISQGCCLNFNSTFIFWYCINIFKELFLSVFWIVNGFNTIYSLVAQNIFGVRVCKDIYCFPNLQINSPIFQKNFLAIFALF
ncbi:hypothetical protein, partial [Geofilum rubicundum]|uniref:hypothetical protein n=1 Tax=Geofilum rubicundum TaxID=472113 RepID=UPI001D0F1478